MEIETCLCRLEIRVENLAKDSSAIGCCGIFIATSRHLARVRRESWRNYALVTSNEHAVRHLRHARYRKKRAIAAGDAVTSTIIRSSRSRAIKAPADVITIVIRLSSSVVPRWNESATIIRVTSLPLHVAREGASAADRARVHAPRL